MMWITQKVVINKIHLVISVLVVIPISLVYGFDPSYQFDIQLQSIDEQSFFKATMGIYLGFSVLWVFGIFKNDYLKIAILSNIVFMLGISLGRLLSVLIDGVPSSSYLFGGFGEFFIGCYGIWVLNNKNTNFAKK